MGLEPSMGSWVLDCGVSCTLKGGGDAKFVLR